MNTTIICVLIRVTGRVQGVGFRHFVLTCARRMGVAGWVRNEPDGSVLIAARGSDADVDEFVESVRRGPRSARVGRVSVERVPPSTEDDDYPELFETRF